MTTYKKKIRFISLNVKSMTIPGQYYGKVQRFLSTIWTICYHFNIDATSTIHDKLQIVALLLLSESGEVIL